MTLLDNMKKFILPNKTSELLWLSDIHLDRATSDVKNRFLEKLHTARYDAVLLTGDISTSQHIIQHLTEISHACSHRSVFYTLGNHDYFGGSISEVENAVNELSRRLLNLVQLGQGEIIELSANTALVGHRGWCDGSAGAGLETKVKSSDHWRIDDFKDLTVSEFFTKMKMMGEESANYFRNVLPKALKKYPKVILGTHVPLFYQSLRYSGGHCGWDYQPFFANCSAGNAVIGIARDFPLRKITVHAGHSHSPHSVRMSKNLEIKVAGAQTGKPALQGMLKID